MYFKNVIAPSKKFRPILAAVCIAATVIPLRIALRKMAEFEF